jgi:hypothetical protein
MQCAAPVELDNPRLKIAFLCLAESGQGPDRIARPGFATLAKWTGVGRSQVYKLIGDLIELQLVARHAPGYRRHTAEFVVFPNGCCEVHGKTPAMAVEDGADVVSIGLDGVAEPAGGWPSMTYPQGPISSDPSTEKGSDLADRKGPIENGKGSDSDPGKGPMVEREIGALQVLTPSTNTPKATTPRRTETGPLTSRDVPPAETHPGRDVGETSALRAIECKHCDQGWLTDRDGLPAVACLHCPTGRQRARETA